MPKLITIDPAKKINNKEEFIAECIKSGLTEAEKDNLVFIFPSNTVPGNKHHAEHGATLYSNKSGGGLAALSATLGNAGIATLGLPTTGIEPVTHAFAIPKIARDAVADLWKAVGYGLTPVLIVREFNSAGQKYFNNPLEGSANKEPRFYGENENTPNLVLADYYTQQINLLNHFLSLDDQARQIFIASRMLAPEKIDAYKAGLTAKTAANKPAWFARTQPQQTQTSTAGSSPIQYQKLMDGREVITAIKGYMLQAGGNVKGVLVEHGLGNILSTTLLAGNKFDDEFKKSINAAKTQLNAGQTRIIVPVHLGDHFATVAIDTAKNTAVIIEPTNSYKTQVDNLEKLLKEIFSSPMINVQQCPTKIQDDSFSCGPIASKLAAHLLTCKEDLVTAIDEQHLPAVVYPLNTEEKKKALVADVQKAYKSKIDSVKKDSEYDCAIQATVLGMFNLIATGQLDDAKYKETQDKLLKLYQAYLRKEAKGASVHPSNETWAKFKEFLLQNDTEVKQKQLAQTFTDLWSGEFIATLKTPHILHRFQNEMLVVLEQEFADFLSNKSSEGKDENYERFTYIKDAFIRFKNDPAYSDDQAKTTAFKNWWKNEGKSRLLNEYIGTGEGKKFPHEFDLQEYVTYLAGLDFDLGSDATNLKNIYTPGYGDVKSNHLNVILVDSTKQIIQELCNEKDGIFKKIVGPNNLEVFRFKKLSDEERKSKLQMIINKYINDADAQKSVVKAILDLVNPKQPHPLLSLTKQGEQWTIIDTVPNTPWLKVKSFKAEVPASDKFTTRKIDFTKAEVKQKIKDVCEHFKTKNAGKKYEVVGDDQVNVDGNTVKVLSDGFEYKKVTKEIIEFVVKAMAEIFTQQGIIDPAQRIVKLTLSSENEKFRKDYQDELRKYNLTLEDKWRNLQSQHTGDQTSADQRQKPASSTAPVTPPAASTASPNAQSSPLTGGATGTQSQTQQEAEQHGRNHPATPSF